MTVRGHTSITHGENTLGHFIFPKTHRCQVLLITLTPATKILLELRPYKC